MAALLDTLVDVVTVIGLIAVLGSLAVIAVVAAVEAFDRYEARKSWSRIEQAREDLTKDFAKEESVASFDFPPREHSTGRKSA